MASPTYQSGGPGGRKAPAGGPYWLTGSTYEGLVNSDRFNNAFIASVGVYESNRFAFKRLYDLSDRNWGIFFQEVEVLMALGPTERLQKLRVLSDDQVASQGDDDYPDQVHCESLRNQGFS